MQQGDFEVPLYLSIPLLTTGLDGPEWLPVLANSDAVGLPLCFMPFMSSYSSVPNQTLKTLAELDMSGDFIFRRADEQDLKVEDVKAMEAYINATPVARLSPQGFREFFVGYILQMGWVDVVCPV